MNTSAAIQIQRQNKNKTILRDCNLKAPRILNEMMDDRKIILNKL